MTVLTRQSRAVRRRARCLLVCVVALLAACGKKGPPLPPLRLVPNGVTEVSGRRSGSDVELRFKLPTANANGTGRIDLDRIEVFAVTVGLGAATPANRDFLTRTYAVGTILVKPPPVEGAGEPPAGTPADTRPSPGDLVTFVETLTDAKLTPAPLPKIAGPVPAAAAGTPPAAAVPGAETPAEPAPAAPVAGEPAPAAAGAIPPVPPLPNPPAAETPPPVPPLPGAPAEAPAAPAPAAPTAAAPTAAGEAAPAKGVTPPAPAGAAAATPAAPPAPTFPMRVYVVRGVSKAGRPGQPSSRVAVPLLPLPPAPDTPKASFTEKAIVLEWTPPPAPAEGGAVLFNVYRTPEPPAATAPPPDAPKPPAPPQAPAAPAPINTSPLAAARLELPGAEFGRRQCFTVRSVQVVANVPLEGEPTAETCVTPRDIFPPASPQRVSVLLLEGAIELVWDAGSEPDLAGYTILRAESPDDTLRPLTPTPVRETTYRDTTVKSGVHYVYAVVAVDKAGNASPPSARVEGIAK